MARLNRFVRRRKTARPIPISPIGPFNWSVGLAHPPNSMFLPQMTFW